MIFSAEAEIRWLDHCESMLSRHGKTELPKGAAPKLNIQPEVRR
jgi:peptidyl-tRNA hydrolase